MNRQLRLIAEEIRNAPREAKSHLYHPLPFLEFQDLSNSSSQAATEKKWDLIEKSLRSRVFYPDLRVLDVGANAGFFAFRFAQRGSKVIAFEPHAHYVDTGERIAEATGLAVDWKQKPLEVTDLDTETFDVALMLSVFQWMSHGNERLDKACVELEAIAANTRVLFFELGCNHGRSAIEVNAPALPWLWRLLDNHTAGKHIGFLGTTAPWGAKRYLFGCSDFELNLSRWQQGVTRAMRRAAPLLVSGVP
jgi:SAM-dependent methyltransferase